MSKRCPECHNVNEDSRLFCSFCGAALDSKLRLIQEMEKQTERPERPADRQQAQAEVKIHSSYSAPKKAEKKKSAAPWIVLGLVAAAVVLWFFLK